VVCDGADHRAVKFLHGDRGALAAVSALPCLDRAGVIAITPALAGTDGHGPAALGAIADAGQESWAAHDAGGHDFRIAGLEPRLNRVKGLPVDQRRNLDHHHLALRLQLLCLAALVALVLADISIA